MNKKVSDVFGIRTRVSEHSYVDRGQLDSAVADLALRDQHIALKGESKSGKSWLRQRLFPNANVVQCRINDTVEAIYRQILANLEIAVVMEKTTNGSMSASFVGTAEAGWKFLAKATGSLGIDGSYMHQEVVRPIGRDEMDIEFIARVVESSDRRVIIEDFHYLSSDVQRQFSHELKTLWDYSAYLVIVGIWHRKNYLTYLNSDLAGRISEVNVGWTEAELCESFRKGCEALHVYVDPKIMLRAARDSFNNIGILQSLALLYFEASKVFTEQKVLVELSDFSKLDDAGMIYADQLEAVYSLFAEHVSEGIRRRKDATQIYAFALWAIMESSDEEATMGLTLDWVFEKSHARQSRIQKANLRTVLRKFKDLQVDDRGKGLVVSFDEATDTIIIIDKGILFYRKYTTQSWPWENIAIEAQEKNIGMSDEVN